MTTKHQHALDVSAASPEVDIWGFASCESSSLVGKEHLRSLFHLYQQKASESTERYVQTWWEGLAAQCQAHLRPTESDSSAIYDDERLPSPQAPVLEHTSALSSHVQRMMIFNEEEVRTTMTHTTYWLPSMDEDVKHEGSHSETLCDWRETQLDETTLVHSNGLLRWEWVEERTLERNGRSHLVSPSSSSPTITSHPSIHVDTSGTSTSSSTQPRDNNPCRYTPNEEEVLYYVGVGSVLKHMALVSLDYFLCLTEDQFAGRYASQFSLLYVSDGFHRAFAALRDGYPLYACAILTSFLERVLGDIVYSYTTNELSMDSDDAKCSNRSSPPRHTMNAHPHTSDDAEVPRKLSELLDAPQVAQVLGEDKILMLKVLVGPFIGLNLRNIIWHGFLTKEEFHPCYPSLLMLILLSMRPLIEQSVCRDGCVFQKREMPTIEELCSFHYGGETVWESYMAERSSNPASSPPSSTSSEHPLPSLSCFIEDRSSILDIFHRSFFFMQPYIPLWEEAYDALTIRGDTCHSLTLMFVLLEHHIRRIFVIANGCPRKMQTATVDSLYTTLDILLDTHVGNFQLNEHGRPITLYAGGVLSDRADTTNALYHAIPNGPMHALLDLLAWNQGGRLRDSLSHAGVQPFNLPIHMAQHVMAVVIALGVHFDPTRPCDTLRHARSLESECLSACCEFVMNYKPTYHPRAIVGRHLIDAFTASLRYKSLVVDREPIALRESSSGDRNHVQSSTREVSMMIDEAMRALQRRTHGATAYIPQVGGSQCEDKTRCDDDDEEETSSPSWDVFGPLLRPSAWDGTARRLTDVNSMPIDREENMNGHDDDDVDDEHHMWSQHIEEQRMFIKSNFSSPTPEEFSALCDIRLSSKCSVLLHVVEQIKHFYVALSKNYLFIRTQVVSMKAWRRHRRSFAFLQEHTVFFYAFGYLLLLMVEENLQDPTLDTTLAQILGRLTGSMVACAQERHFKRLASLAATYMESQISHPYDANIGQKERDRMVEMCSIRSYLNSLHGRCPRIKPPPKVNVTFSASESMIPSHHVRFTYAAITQSEDPLKSFKLSLSKTLLYHHSIHSFASTMNFPYRH